MKRAMTFEEFLKSKQASGEQQLDWKARKETWKADVAHLYSDIRNWLAQEQQHGLLSITEEPIKIQEEYLGEYESTSLALRIGDEVIQLIPRGTIILGATGRVDMRGSTDEVMIIREKEGAWKFAYRDHGQLVFEPVEQNKLKEWIQRIS